MDDDSSKGPDSERERRKVERHFTCYPFHIQTGDAGETSEAEIAIIQDLSASGAFLLTAAEPSVGVRLKLHLDMFGDAARIKVLEGRVLRTERRPREVADVWRFGVAVQFDEVHADLEPAIAELSKRLQES